MQHVIKVDEEEECVPAVLERLGRAKFIRLDGHSCVGKSRIARALVAALGWHHVELDKLVNREAPGRYPDKVKLDEVNQRIIENRRGAILDGIWSNHIVPPDTHGNEFKIYMRACFAPEHDDDVRDRNRELGTDVYHRAYHPERWADLVVMKIALK